MTCEQVRERLAEHVLGTVEGADDIALRRHLRACSSCRAEMAALGEGLALFSRAAHDQLPPDDLQDRVRAVLSEEWRDPQPGSNRKSRPARWISVSASVAAAGLVLALTLGWGMSQSRRAEANEEGSQSYQRLLTVLGGKDFRVGPLEPAGREPLEGSVVVYDSHIDQSWVVVFIRTSGVKGRVTATLHADDGRTVDVWPFRIDREGEGAGWLVTSVNLERFDELTVSCGENSRPLATADIVEA
jgi:hypothetical protein